MKMSKMAVALASAACLITSAIAVAAPFKVQGDPKVAIILFGPKNDGGWSQAFMEALPAMEKALGETIPVVDKVPEDAASITPPAERFIQRGYNVIIGTAFGYSDTFKKLSEAHPDVAFLNASGTTNGPNLESFYGRTYESQYLCGMAAAAASKTGKLGFVAANPLPVVNWTINAYELGAKTINPNATVTVVFTGAWNDPVKERAAASALIDEGIDVIGQHVDTPTPQIVAQERGVYSTGHHRDLTEFAPKANQCSSIWTWSKFLVPELEKIKAGTWEPSPYGAFPGIKEGGTDISCCGSAVSEENKKKIFAARQSIIDGFPVFVGPLKDRDGKERLAAGQPISDADLWKMDWFVDGVISQK
ncbi:BMP family ABC transporter substrate-binding protein [Segnochrobactrum spirostomi]|uniref:BMP family ABC transporter substrate-binding protein n=1 Tax=Segnochrobactrum spirostomi TaxID=2608987 RepID=A0A6A7YB81_9HYPH|nr:BMP family ABC transporter substrate-binding protein [Segnochrobactrum spirostomi]MQT14922.1 BMP family ABC transporter substrate-binding protein [Segnochrobactrum spirostomi]